MPSQIHLILVEREKADDVLRYAETETKSDGAFNLTNLAPGKYWLLPRSKTDDRAPFDAARRVALRREAEALNNVIELQPCQRLANYELSLNSDPN